MIKITVALTLVLLVLYKMFFVNNKKLCANKSVENFTNKFYVPIVVVLFCLTFATTFFKLGSVPYGINVDEAGASYDAWCLANFGVDRYLNKFPVYFINFGGGQSVLYGYMVAFFIKIFGFSMWAVRLPLAVVRMVMTYCIWATVKKEKNKIKDILVLLLMAIVPYFIMQSRWGLDCNMMVGFVTIAVYFLIKAVNKPSYLAFALTGLFFGISAYTYVLSWMFLPVFLAGTCFYLLWTKKITFLQILTMGAVAFVVAFPLVLFLLVNNGIIEPIHSFITVPKLPWFRSNEIGFGNIYNSVDVFKIILSHDGLDFNAYSEYGTIYYMNVVFCIVGIVMGIQKLYQSLETKKYSLNGVITIWFLSLIATQLITDQPSVSKANVVFVPLVYFTAMGIYELTKKVKLMLIPIVVLLLINLSVFSGFYFTEGKHNSQELFFPTYYIEALDYSNDLGKDTVYIGDLVTIRPAIYSNLLSFVNPYDFNEEIVEFEHEGETIIHNFKNEKIIDKDGVYIVNNQSDFIDELEAEGFEHEKFGYLSVYF